MGSLNSIGPAVTISRRGSGWSVRFRLPQTVADKHSLSHQCRLTCRLPDAAGHDRLVREANRIGALLDLFIRGEAGPAEGQSLAGWLGLPEPKRTTRPPRAERSQRTRRADHTLWPDLVEMFAQEYRSRTLSREGNEAITLGRLERIAAAFPGRTPNSITSKEWSKWLDSLDTGVPAKNRLRDLASRTYRFGIGRFICQSNPFEAVPKRKLPRSSVKHTYMTLRMIEDELARRDYTEQEDAEMRRWRVLDEREQKDFVELVRHRDPEFLPCAILALHGVSGIDIRTAKKGAYDIRTGIFTGMRTKKGSARFSVPISPALKPVMDKYVMALPDGSMMFPWLDGVKDRKEKYLRRWWQLVAGTEFEGLRAHALRHSYISTLLSRQVPAETIAKFVGHLETRTTVEVYGAFLPDNAVELVAKLRLFEAG